MGFEAPSVGTDTYSAFQYASGGTPWTHAVVAGDDSGFTSGNPAAPEGTQVGCLQGANSSTQTVASWAAGSYVISLAPPSAATTRHPNRTSRRRSTACRRDFRAGRHGLPAVRHRHVYPHRRRACGRRPVARLGRRRQHRVPGRCPDRVGLTGMPRGAQRHAGRDVERPDVGLLPAGRINESRMRRPCATPEHLDRVNDVDDRPPFTTLPSVCCLRH
jgi:hypothetical protein